MKKLFCLLLLVSLTGCSLVPKRVELFQDKVQKVPEYRSSERETQRQTAALAAKRADETLVAAVANDSPVAVVAPAADAAVLTKSVSTSLGPPSSPWTGEALALATKLDHSVAALNKRLDEFKEDNNDNAGKKIEGTGLFQVPYFVWLGGAAVICFVGFLLLSVLWGAVKVFALTNPPVALGLNAARLATSTVSKGLSQLIQGGENFKEAVTSKFGSSEVAEQVLELFRHEHEKAQDVDVRTAVEHLTK